jgi:hypothetical protein
MQAKIMLRVFICALIAATAALRGSTLQQLSLDDMIRKSAAIVHARVVGSSSAFRGSLIYTHYQIQVSETLKGPAAAQWDVAVPGGVTKGMRQSFAGAPALLGGQDYVLFLWTSRTGLTQVIGLSQGLFTVVTGPNGQPSVVRAATTETMLNAAGQPVTDSDIQMALSDLRSRIQSTLNGRGAE